MSQYLYSSRSYLLFSIHLSTQYSSRLSHFVVCFLYVQSSCSLHHSRAEVTIFLMGFAFLEYSINTCGYHATKTTSIPISTCTEVPQIRDRIYSGCDVMSHYRVMNSCVHTVKRITELLRWAPHTAIAV